MACLFALLCNNQPQQILLTNDTLLIPKFALQVTTVFDDTMVHKIKGISEYCPRDQMFFHKRENRERSVEEYFENTYGRRLHHPELPCVDCSTKRKPVMLPPEFAL